MKPISFHEDEQTLHPPKGSKNIVPVQVLTVTYLEGIRGIISCWRPTVKDILRMLIKRRIYLAILGTMHPPVLVTTDGEEVGVT